MDAVDLLDDGDVGDICVADVEDCVDDSVDVDVETDADVCVESVKRAVRTLSTTPPSCLL